MTAADQTFVVGPPDEPDKYRLRRQVGGGGEAELWEADVAFLGSRERVAVKILRERHVVDLAGWQDRWAEQAELLRLVQRPGVVGVHQHFAGPVMHRPGSADHASQALYLVMNWVDGHDLRDWVVGHSGAADRLEGLRYLVQVADVLDWLHDGRATSSGRPVVHGDVSPANVVVNVDGQAVLVDFGLFRITRHVTDVASGTPGYRAPELLQGGEYSPATDRYAFGALAYYVLSGANPPEDPSALAEALRGLPRVLSVVDAGADLGRIVARDPVHRPPAGEWVRQLRLQSSTAHVSGGGLPPLAPHRPPPLPSGSPDAVWSDGRERRMTSVKPATLAVVLTAAVVLAVALVVGLNRSSGEGSSLTNGATLASTASSTGQIPPSQGPAPQAPLPSVSVSTALPTSATTAPPRRTSRTVSILALQPDTSTLQQGAWTVDGTKYEQSLGGHGSATYQLAGGYTTFAATLASEGTVESQLEIILDGRKPVQRRATADHPVALEVDVTGVQMMTINLSASPYELAVVGRATLRT